MGLAVFSEKEKADMFDEIAKHFYDKNFGQFSKTDMELLMFKFYIDKVTNCNKNADGTINYQRCSDFAISRELGITQQRVRNLKVKKQLIYPMNYDWKKAFAELSSNARYDRVTKKIVMNIPDPNLFLEIENFFDTRNYYIEKQLNSKILQIRAEYFIDLVVEAENEDNRKKIIKRLKNELKENNKTEPIFDENNIGKTILESSASIIPIVELISDICSPDNMFINTLKILIMKGFIK